MSSGKLLGVDTSRALDLTPKRKDFVDNGNPESIYRQKEYILELKYVLISGVSILLALNKVPSEGVPPQACPACRGGFNANVSEDMSKLLERFSVLIGIFNEQVNLEISVNKEGICEFDAEERHKIGLEACWTIKKIIETRDISEGAKVKIVDNFYSSKLEPKKS